MTSIFRLGCRCSYGTLPRLARSILESVMKKLASFLLFSIGLAVIPAGVTTQEAGYPVEVIPPGKGPFTFPDGYQTPWDKIQIMVTSKMSSNLFVLHGSQGLD